MHKLAWILLIIGGLNWLIYGLFSWEVGMLFGDPLNVVARIIYILVGLSALYELFTHKRSCKNCESKMSGAPAGGEMKM